jgi:hypothetical protein
MKIWERQDGGVGFDQRKRVSGNYRLQDAMDECSNRHVERLSAIVPAQFVRPSRLSQSSSSAKADDPVFTKRR